MKRALIGDSNAVQAAKGSWQPLSYAQERLWFLDQLDPGGSSYNGTLAVALEGRLDALALERSLNEICRRHETLRTSFAMVGGRPGQAISAARAWSLPVVDLQGFARQECEAEVRRRIQEQAACPFDLSCPPLLRTVLLRVAEEEHVFVLTVHHIVSDGWSMGVLFEELKVLYEAFSAGRPSPLPELTFQYKDFALWQRQWLAEGALERQLSYWKRQLRGGLPILELPTDRPRAAMQSSRGASEDQVLPASLTESLRQLSLQEGCTLFMTLLAAFQVLLYRYTGQEDIAVGSPIANRTRSETEGLIGFFVNTLVLRTDLSVVPDFRHLLRRVREMTLEAYAHQDLPFEKLVEELQPERDLSHTPLFQVMFVLQNASEQEFELPGLRVAPVEVETQTATFDLTLSMQEGSEGLSAVWEYNADLFDAATIVRMMGHFEQLLAGIAANADQSIATLPLLTAEERQQVLVQWNETATDYPGAQCIHQLFEAQAERTPEAIAVVLDQKQLSYEALNRRANQLAHRLRALGVGPDVLVGICLERSFDMIVAILGILKAGGAYVPLDPTYPHERLAFMLADARASVLLTQEKFLDRLPGASAQILCLDSNWHDIARECEQNPPNTVTPHNLIYVIYTSGSTGSPKGAMIAHLAVTHRLFWTRDTCSFSSADRLLQRAPLGFDVSACELFLALISGATLVLASPGEHTDAAYLVKLIREHEITAIICAPSLLQILLEEPDLQSCKDLRLVLCGAEPLPADAVSRFFERLNAELHNVYGPTEACFHVTGWKCDPTDLRRTTPIGRPVSNVQIYLLDSRLQPVPIGVTGELHIGGIGLARGYLHRPELTMERFVANPFCQEPGARLYRTGDLARYRLDGNIEFLGRIDHQVKIRGFRIELGEIEAVLGGYPRVRECVVIAREHAPDDKRLVAYVVAGESERLSASELRNFLKEKLPDYMVPSNFIFLDALPLTPNGKVDRIALPALGQAVMEPTNVFMPPRNEIEHMLAIIWTQILGIDRVGVHDNFFELGGHSLLATKLVSRLRDAFQIELPLRAIFETPTISTLASRVRGISN